MGDGLDELKESDGDRDELAGQLSRLLLAIEAGSRAVLPASHDELLTSIVSAAARIFGAAAAAILLIDEDEVSLVFRVAIGEQSESLVGVRIPIDKGIAGYVAMTGQPIAVSNTEQDARFYQDFAQRTGYVPQSILATPLFSGDRVIGVMEVLDKIDAASFGMQDLELMGLFAQQAALAIDLSQQMERVTDALVDGLTRIVAGDGLPDSAALVEALSRGRRRLPEAQDIFALAGLFSDLSALGQAERRAALKMMTALAEYAQSRPHLY